MFSSAVPSWPGAAVTMGARLSSCAQPQSLSVTLCPSRDPRKNESPSRLNHALYLNFTFIWPVSQTRLSLFHSLCPALPLLLSWPAAHLGFISVGRCPCLVFPHPSFSGRHRQASWVRYLHPSFELAMAWFLTFSFTLSPYFIFKDTGDCEGNL